MQDSLPPFGYLIIYHILFLHSSHMSLADIACLFFMPVVIFYMQQRDALRENEQNYLNLVLQFTACHFS